MSKKKKSFSNPMPTMGSYDTPIIEALALDKIPAGTHARFWLHVVTDGVGSPILVPIMVAKGREAGPVLGITAAVHGNELNGVSVIQRAFKELDVDTLRGTVVGVPVVNVPSTLRRKRRFVDGRDLNHIMPGREDGNVSEQYAFRIFHRIINRFDYLIDLHTASFGRVNSYYIRADMSEAITARLAVLQNAQIIVNNPPSDGTLRGAANELGIPAITLEVGDPNTFQRGMIRSGLTGIYNALCYLNMIDEAIEEPETPTVHCKRSYWMYTDDGGILRVFPRIAQKVKKGELVAALQNVFGDLIKEYVAPEDGIVIGHSINPISQTGARILHLGILK